MKVASSLKTNLRCGVEVCGYAVDASGFIVSEVDPLEKTLKVVSKSIDLFSFIKETEAGTLISTQFKSTISLIETLSFFRNLQSVIRPNKDGIFFFQDLANSWQKCAARISILAHNVLKLFVAAKKWKLIELAIASKYLIGRIPFFTLVTEGLYGLYNFLSTWDNVNVLINCCKASSLVEKKIVKWEKRAKNIDLIAAGDPSEIAHFKNRCAAKIQSLHVLTETNVAALDKVASKIAKLPLWQARLDKIVKRDYQTLAEEMRAQDIAPKLSKWKFNKHTVRLNRNKALMALCSTAAKTAAVALTLFFMAINVWTTPIIILVTTLSLIGDSIGITRIVYDKFPPKYKKPLVSCEFIPSTANQIPAIFPSPVSNISTKGS